MQQPHHKHYRCVSSSSCQHDYANTSNFRLEAQPGERDASRPTERRVKRAQYFSPANERAKTRNSAPSRPQDWAQVKRSKAPSSRRLIHLFEHSQSQQADRSARESPATLSKQSTTMRNIITPVDYQASESDLSDDSLDDQRLDVDKLDARERRKTNFYRKLTKPNWAPPTDYRQYEHLTSASSPICPNGPQPRSTLSFAHRAATCGPSIVRHQKSSSKRLLNQLARLRKLDEPLYRVKRPEKVAQVESLIEQLEKVASDLQEDEHLLDRADRRDWPAEFHRRLIEEATGTTCDQVSKLPSKPETNQSAVLDPAAYRVSDPMEEEAVTRSHLRLSPIEPSGSTLPTRLFRTRPLPYADRYLDDLAVRRLSHLGKTSSLADQQRPHQMSYLLCTSAYTSNSTKQSTSIYEDQLELDRRLLLDDFHYRNYTRAKLDPFEPPFGIPRQVSSHSSASHYLRQQQGQSRSLYRDPCVDRRNESRVSFSLKQTSPVSGRVSADSGLPPGIGSPMSPGFGSSDQPRPSSSTGNLTKLQPKAPLDTDDRPDDAALEIDLAPELADGEAPNPILEFCQAEYRATPSRDRPRIQVRNPRARSPLIRTSSRTPSPLPTACKLDPSESPVQVQCYTDTWSRRRKARQELEVCYDFSNDEDDVIGIDDHIYNAGPSIRASPIVTTLDDNSSSCSSANTSSLERLQYRGDLNKPDEAIQVKSDSPRFSIGEYRTLSRRSGLKIL